MGFIDKAKKYHSSLLDRINPQRVVFHHVPKCGGTSVGRAIRQRYIMSQATVTPESSFRAFEAFTGRTDRENMLVDVLDIREIMLLYLLYEDVRCISLHVRFSKVAYERFKSHYKFITILREPVSRFVSHYFWSYQKHGAHACIDENFDDFLNSDRARRMGASYVEFFCGLPKDADITSESAINSAIENLARFDVVGKLDDLKSFEHALGLELGVRLKIGHENKMRQKSTAKLDDIVTPELLKKVEILCAPDVAVWRSVFET